MKRPFTLLSLAALFSCFTAFGESQQRGDAKWPTLNALKIESATIMQLERDPTETKTIVKLELNPAKGSHINVEVWLPDADKWNGRFLGLGNGGAAPTAFTSPMTGRSPRRRASGQRSGATVPLRRQAV